MEVEDQKEESQIRKIRVSSDFATLHPEIRIWRRSFTTRIHEIIIMEDLLINGECSGRGSWLYIQYKKTFGQELNWRSILWYEWNKYMWAVMDGEESFDDFIPVKDLRLKDVNLHLKEPVEQEHLPMRYVLHRLMKLYIPSKFLTKLKMMHPFPLFWRLYREVWWRSRRWTILNIESPLQIKIFIYKKGKYFVYWMRNLYHLISSAFCAKTEIK